MNNEPSMNISIIPDNARSPTAYKKSKIGQILSERRKKRSLPILDFQTKKTSEIIDNAMHVVSSPATPPFSSQEQFLRARKVKAPKDMPVCSPDISLSTSTTSVPFVPSFSLRPKPSRPSLIIDYDDQVMNNISPSHHYLDINMMNENTSTSHRKTHSKNVQQQQQQQQEHSDSYNMSVVTPVPQKLKVLPYIN